jgi:hypothetical protein
VIYFIEDGQAKRHHQGTNIMLVQIAAALVVLLVVCGLISATIGWEIALGAAALGAAVLWFGAGGFVAVIVMAFLASVCAGYAKTFEGEWFGAKPTIVHCAIFFGGMLGFVWMLAIFHI